ncbi:Uncharacterised protein [Mycobacteroides abscessus subsp. abscessus]|nr:Uncharacterised protein [Mycobacteroides abscessus subsp. abscessus]
MLATACAVASPTTAPIRTASDRPSRASGRGCGAGEVGETACGGSGARANPVSASSANASSGLGRGGWVGV